jgi:hypothetical protein
MNHLSDGERDKQEGCRQLQRCGWVEGRGKMKCTCSLVIRRSDSLLEVSILKLPHRYSVAFLRSPFFPHETTMILSHRFSPPSAGRDPAF